MTYDSETWLLRKKWKKKTKQNTASVVLHRNKLRNGDIKAELNLYSLEEEIWNYR